MYVHDAITYSFELETPLHVYISLVLHFCFPVVMQRSRQMQYEKNIMNSNA